MIDRRTISLINAEVDGYNTPHESETLRQILAQDPEARKLFEDLRKLEQKLSSVSPVDPPAGLKRSIMRSIREHRAPVRKHARSFNPLAFLFPARPLPRLGFAFSGGVLAGILLVIIYFAVATPPSYDVRDASGTLFGTSSEALQTAEDETIAGEGVVGRVVTEYSGTISAVRVDLTLKPDVTARFLFNPVDTKLRGVRLGEKFPGTLMQREGLLEVGDGGGSFRAFFALDGSSDENVRFQVLSGGDVLYERSLLLRKTH